MSTGRHAISTLIHHRDGSEVQAKYAELDLMRRMGEFLVNAIPAGQPYAVEWRRHVRVDQYERATELTIEVEIRRVQTMEVRMYRPDGPPRLVCGAIPDAPVVAPYKPRPELPDRPDPLPAAYVLQPRRWWRTLVNKVLFWRPR